MLDADAVIGSVYDNGTVVLDDYYVDVNLFFRLFSKYQRLVQLYALNLAEFVPTRATELKDKTTLSTTMVKINFSAMSENIRRNFKRIHNFVVDSLVKYKRYEWRRCFKSRQSDSYSHLGKIIYEKIFI